MKPSSLFFGLLIVMFSCNNPAEWEKEKINCFINGIDKNQQFDSYQYVNSFNDSIIKKHGIKRCVRKKVSGIGMYLPDSSNFWFNKAGKIIFIYKPEEGNCGQITSDFIFYEYFHNGALKSENWYNRFNNDSILIKKVVYDSLGRIISYKIEKDSISFSYDQDNLEKTYYQNSSNHNYNLSGKNRKVFTKNNGMISVVETYDMEIINNDTVVSNSRKTYEFDRIKRELTENIYTNQKSDLTTYYFDSLLNIIAYTDKQRAHKYSYENNKLIRKEVVIGNSKKSEHYWLYDQEVLKETGYNSAAGKLRILLFYNDRNLIHKIIFKTKFPESNQQEETFEYYYE